MTTLTTILCTDKPHRAIKVLFILGVGLMTTQLIFHGISTLHLNRVYSPSTQDTTAKRYTAKRDSISHDISCNFPEQDPYHPSAMKHHIQQPPADCSQGLPSLVYVDGDFLRINTTKVMLKNISVDYCTYRTLTLVHDYWVVRSDRSAPFRDSIQIGSQQDHLVVKCFYRYEMVSNSFLSRIIEKNVTEETCSKNYEHHVNSFYPKETMSVLMVGIDGISRQNSIRSMPKTRQFVLDEMNAIELYKFNKVGDNTFPNVIPLLSGLSVEEFRLHWTPDDYFDIADHLMLWHTFKQAGYRTGVMFDTKGLTAFNYGLKGWKYPSFDYYRRPMIAEIYKDPRPTLDCVGDIPEAPFLLDYWHQLCKTFNNTRTKPYFGYSFITRQTHTWPTLLTAVDVHYLEFFQKLERDRVLNNTVVVFFSDHGARFGDIRRTRHGIKESRTPFIFLMFPRWFQKKYPHIMTTLRTNQHRLTTFFDIHATLNDLLHFTGETGKGNLTSRGISLFKEIPRDRLCHHAGIPLVYCMCHQLHTTDNLNASSTLSKTLANGLLQHIIHKTNKYRDQCEILEIVRILFISELVDNTCKACRYFHIVVELAPGQAVFEAVLEHVEAIHVMRVIGDVPRLSFYRGQAECLADITLRPFCYCKR